MNAPALREPGTKVLLMGNEAIARGAIEAGIDVAAAYPGTPSSEILETLWQASRTLGFYAEWSTNEKVAFEVASGASLAGARALCAMKNAGLNVAMDTFTALAYTGIRGGFVLVVADDPGAHYSSTEQDTRPLAAYAEIPCLEPCNQEEARDMTREAFEISETLEMPVMVRSVTRLSHASGDVVLKDPVKRTAKLGFNKHYGLQFRWNVYGAPGAVSKHEWLHGVLERAKQLSEGSPFNRVTLLGQRPLGVVASGIGYAYVYDALQGAGLLGGVNLLKVGFIHPFPDGLVEKLVSSSEKVLVVEEGDPYLERRIRELSVSQGKSVFGKLQGPSQALKPWGELNPDLVRAAIFGALGLGTGDQGSTGAEEARAEARKIVVPRSSTLCPGCPHLGSYWALKRALARRPGVHIVNGDIGCYEQGGYGLFGQSVQPSLDSEKKYPIRTPYETLDTLYVMGSGLGMAQGQSHLTGLSGKKVAVSGDSTMFHALLPSIANAALTEADVVYLVLDNRWTAMTGHQPSPRTGMTPLSDPMKTLDLESVLRSLGIEKVYRASSFDLPEAGRAIDQALDQHGPAVVILEGECALQLQRRKETKPPLAVDALKCTGCRTCVQLGCSAILFDPERKKAAIEAGSCVGCGICAPVCPAKAIGPRSQADGQEGDSVGR